MENFLGRIRTGAGKAAFEADKLRRVTVVQSTISGLKKEAEKSYYQIGRVAYGLYENGRITQPELQTACDQLAGLQAEIAAHEQEIAAIRAEGFVEPQTAPVQASTQYGRICPNGHGAIPEQDTFCQTCGAKAVYAPPPTLAAGMALCPNCHTPLAAEARFCATCGQLVTPPAPVAEPVPAAAACVQCGAALLPDAIFCAECGRRVERAETVEQETDAVGEGETVPELADAPKSAELEMEAADESPPIMDDILELEEIVESEVETAVPETNTCSSCGAPLLSDALFCLECGHQIGAEA
jgi:predicted amidophosphoribosyltransferase